MVSDIDEKAFLTALSNAGIKGSIRSQGNIAYDFDALPWNLRCQPKLSRLFMQQTLRMFP
jgi:hypothetical protein